MTRKKTTEQFIIESKLIFDNLDYSKVVYTKPTINVILICLDHKLEFEQTPNSNLKGTIKCPECLTIAIREKNKAKFIAKATKNHEGKYNYDNIVYIDSTTPVSIICPKHGVFMQTPAVHINHNCPKCSGVYHYTQEEIIEEFKKAHPKANYDYSEVIYVNLETKVIIYCPKHKLKFEQVPKNHLHNNTRCPECGKEAKIKNKTKSHEQFIAECILEHGNTYDYSLTNYEHNKKPIIIICSEHGEFSINAGNHLYQKHGCPKCGINKRADSRTKTTEQFIKEAILIHGDRFDYSQVIYNKSNEKVVIICKDHGEFLQTPGGHLSDRNGCPKCAHNTKSNTEEFIEKSKERFKDKYEFDYSKTIYTGNKDPLIIRCVKHNYEFTQNSIDHLKCAIPCPQCRKCPSCLLWQTRGKLCLYCKPKKRNNLYMKTKEVKVVNFLKDKLPDNEFIHNKSVGEKCTGGRLYPDIRFDCNWFQLIIEVDEFQHRGASYNCEEKRMCDITAKLGMVCIFIRYNPDSDDSNLDELLKKIKEYLELSKTVKISDLKLEGHKGFRAEYMFYD